MSIKNIILVVLVGISTNVFGVEVSSEKAGSLQSLLSNENIATLTTLTVSGPVDASDLFYIGNNANKLERLDLSMATIVEYNGDKTINGYSTYPANVIPAGVFAGTALKWVSIPSSTTQIGSMAFASSCLESLPVLDNVKMIDDGAFAATLIKELAYPDADLGSNVFAGSEVKTVYISHDVTIAPGAFAGCQYLENVDGADKATAIGNGAFEQTPSLKNFKFGNSISVIGSNAFRASGLNQVNLNVVDSIGTFAFAQMPNLVKVSVSDKNVRMAPGAFFDDNNLQDIQLDSPTVLPDYIFKGTAISNIPLNNTTEIGQYALASNSGASLIVLPASLQHINTGAMENMSALKTIDASALDNVPSLGNDVWDGVDQQNVILKVNEASEQLFKNAPQWQEFNISAPTGVDDVATGVTAVTVKARFNGNVLQVVATGVEISQISLFDINGAMLIATNVNALSAEVDTAQFANPYFVVSVTLADGSRSSLKLRR